MLPSKISRILIDIKDHKRVMETNHAFAAVMLLQLVPLVRGCPGVQKENQQLQFHGKAAAELFPLGRQNVLYSKDRKRLSSNFLWNLRIETGWSYSIYRLFIWNYGSSGRLKSTINNSQRSYPYEYGPPHLCSVCLYFDPMSILICVLSFWLVSHHNSLPSATTFWQQAVF